MEAAIVAEGVRKTYGDTVALGGVDLAVGAGEVFGLIGPNGAGKTTLVRALVGTIDPDEGAVGLLGERPRAVARERVGLLPQDFRPPERLTARELVGYYRGLYDDGRDPGTVLGEVGLAAAAGARYDRLSGGQQRRVCVATALVNDPDVLFLDEPTTGIDPAGRRALWTLLDELAAGGTTVLFTTHYMAEAERLADRVGLLGGGELVAAGPPADLIAEHGGRPRLEVETDAPAGVLADADFRVENGDGGVVFPGIDPVEIGDAVEALEERGVDYGALTWTEPDLEDVYLRLTGEHVEPGARAPGTRVRSAAGAKEGADAGAGAGGDRRP